MCVFVDLLEGLALQGQPAHQVNPHPYKLYVIMWMMFNAKMEFMFHFLQDLLVLLFSRTPVWTNQIERFVNCYILYLHLQNQINIPQQDSLPFKFELQLLFIVETNVYRNYRAY